jgi:chemotaxis protein CheX
MYVARSQIAAATEEIASVLLGIQLERTEDLFTVADDNTYQGFVEITGDWNGKVLIRCDRGFAKDIAAVMFRTSGEIGVDDLHDTLIELANIIGGNIKSLISSTSADSVSPCQLSTPERIEENDVTQMREASSVVSRVNYRFGSHRLEVELLQGPEAQVEPN